MNVFQYPLTTFSSNIGDNVMVEGKGTVLYDARGKKYQDCISGLWNIPLGYANTEIIDAIEKQLHQLPFINLITEKVTIFDTYANKLIKVLPKNQRKILVTSSGSESVELAIKAARKYHMLRGDTDKKIICSLDLSYHGTSYMAMAVSGMDRVESRNYIETENVAYLPAPYCQCCRASEMKEACREQIKAQVKSVFEIKGKRIAALILEPVIGSGGIIPLPQWYCKLLVEECNKYNVLIIDDEVATGFGRTGKMFSIDDKEIVPDFVCMSKGINNGYLPFGAVSIGDVVSDLFIQQNQFVEHFSTQNGNMVSCAAAMATLDILTNSDIINDVEEHGRFFLAELEKKLIPIPGVCDVRGMGYMFGIDLKDNEGKILSLEALQRIYAELKERGILVYYFYVENTVSGISLFPQYIMGEMEFMGVIKQIKRVLEKNLRYIY